MQSQQPKLPATLKVKVLRAFQDHRRQILRPAPQGKVEVHELPRVFALGMKAANKVEIVEEEAPVAAAPKQEESSASGKGGNGRKEK